MSKLRHLGFVRVNSFDRPVMLRAAPSRPRDPSVTADGGLSLGQGDLLVRITPGEVTFIGAEIHEEPPSRVLSPILADPDIRENMEPPSRRARTLTASSPPYAPLARPERALPPRPSAPAMPSATPQAWGGAPQDLPPPPLPREAAPAAAAGVGGIVQVPAPQNQVRYLERIEYYRDDHYFRHGDDPYRVIRVPIDPPAGDPGPSAVAPPLVGGPGDLPQPDDESADGAPDGDPPPPEDPDHDRVLSPEEWQAHFDRRRDPGPAGGPMAPSAPHPVGDQPQRRLRGRPRKDGRGRGQGHGGPA